MYQSTQVPLPSKCNLREATSHEGDYNHLCFPQLSADNWVSSPLCLFFTWLSFAGCMHAYRGQSAVSKSYFMYWEVLFYPKNHKPSLVLNKTWFALVSLSAPLDKASTWTEPDLSLEMKCNWLIWSSWILQHLVTAVYSLCSFQVQFIF